MFITLFNGTVFAKMKYAESFANHSLLIIMNSVPEAETTQIVFVGRKNTGKSSLINAFFGEEVAAINDMPGNISFYNLTELLPYGPVVLVDTAGIDEDEGIGEKRITRTLKLLSSADLAVVILDATKSLTNEEVELFFCLHKISVPYIVVVNKIEFGVDAKLLTELNSLKIMHYEISCKERVGIDELKIKIMRKLPRESNPLILSGLLTKGSVVMFVIPEDMSVPGSKCALFQVNYIKELISDNSVCMVTKDSEMKAALGSLSRMPDLVITDSSILKKVSEEIPASIKLTTFSMLLGKQKGNLKTFCNSLKKLDEIKDGDKILIAEACNYHNPRNDSGANIFPQWIRTNLNSRVNFDTSTGGELPENLGEYKMVIHCNGCMISRKEMQVRLNEASLLDVPVVSYGILAAYINGGIPRVLAPFS